jgi:hypothetical protein
VGGLRQRTERGENQEDSKTFSNDRAHETTSIWWHFLYINYLVRLSVGMDGNLVPKVNRKG